MGSSGVFAVKTAALTPTERTVLGLIGRGWTSKEIADALRISVLTVGNHRKSICRKLDLHSTAQLAAFAAGTSKAEELPFGTPCSLTLKWKTEHGDVRISYRGSLSSSPCVATFSIGDRIYHF
jgi:DNA-binding CsgD family transcriptional regulator